ncbi:MAG: hypothetical protein RIT45_3328 [Pseudomonadota bacterium]
MSPVLRHPRAPWWLLCLLWCCSSAGSGGTDLLAPCETGVGRFCTCASGDVGIQTCVAGNFVPCMCKPIDGGQTDLDTSTDTGAASDIGEPVSTPNCPGGSGCPCVSNFDCQNSLCIEDLSVVGGKLCAQTCVENCPSGYSCAQVTTASNDIISICINPFGRLCEPCSASKDCASLGLTDSQCVDEGPLGHFCGIACSGDSGCPAEYACAAVTTVEGGEVKQCVRKPDAQQQPFGVCPCSPVATQKKLATACYVEAQDAGGQIIGKCAGQRSCGDAGLSPCSAAVAVEVCNGKDDDCDGQVDETTCDDGTDCTSDLCKGKSGCEHIPMNGAPCDADGSVCTTGDSCQAGVCTAGTALDCDDKNPCTQDSCQQTKGCVHTANTANCSDGNACTSGDSCAAGACVGKAMACDDGNPCTVDGCDPQTGCTTAGAADGAPCGAGLECKGGACAPPAPVCGLGTVAIPIDVGGVAAIACGAVGPVWGARSDTYGGWGPVVAGTVADPQTGLTWMTAMSAKQMNWSDAQAWCDGLELGGQKDWRLPTWLELRTTLATNKIQLAILEPPFTGTPWEPMVPSAWTWTGSSAPGKADKAWALNYTFGSDLGMGKQTLAWARCVRGSVVGKPADSKRFVISAAGGTVVDTWTNLTWQRGSKELGSNAYVADTYCAKLQLEGDSWRLPTVTELAGLIDVTAAGVQTDAVAFPGVKPENYWTKSPATGYPGGRWSCAFMEPAICEAVGYSNNSSRCVR